MRIIAGLLAAAVILWVAAVFVSAAQAAQCGTASFYGAAHHGKPMANGQPFNRHAMTAAMWGPAFGSRYRVRAGGRSVVVTITDRGPAKRLGRLIDLSEAAFAKIAPLRQGLARVCIERLP